jgi:hypothetical protein
MSEIVCPSCNRPLTARDLADGWCDACGKQIPEYVRRAAGSARLVETAPAASGPVGQSVASDPTPAQPAGRLRVKWGFLALALLFLSFSALLLGMAIYDVHSSTPSTSRRVQAMERLLGERGTNALCGLVFLGLAIYFGYNSVGRELPTPETAPPATPPERAGWWLVPLPLERRALARGAAVLGLLSSVPLALALGGFVLLFPLFWRPLDLGGIICLGPGAGLTVALVAHFLAVRRGYRLSLLGWLAVPTLFFGLVWLVNRTAPDRELASIEQRILAGHDGEPDFAPDPELKTAFVTVLDRLGKDPKPTLYFRCTEKHETDPTPEAETALVLWKLDPDFAEYVRLKMDIPGSRPACIDLHGSHVRQRLEAALRPIVPERRLKIETLTESDSGAGKLVLDLEATTRHEGTFAKFSSSFGRPSLVANIRIEWRLRLLDRDGTELYASAWTTRPSAGLAFRDMPLGAAYAPYKLLQLSAHDNFARELLGRLGLPPGPVRTEWSFEKDW